ncbi:MAG: SDR family NAD(P)-dependent oxidoreductase [Opitutales bacterium]
MRTLSEHYRAALVTGASSGLGAAFTDMLLAEGLEVYGTSRSPEKMPERPGLHRLPLDLADGDSMGAFLESMQEEWPKIDVLVNNAGNGIFNRFEEFEPEQIGEQLRVLLHGPMALCHAALPHFLLRGNGMIVNVASLARAFPLPYFSLYNAAKAGLSNFSRSLQTELSGTGVGVIDFQPGDYRTRFNAEAARPDELDLDPRLKQAWESLDAHLRAAPEPEKAARGLRRALARGRSDTVATGAFFQAVIAPLLYRIAPWRAVEWGLRKYYGI